MRVVLQRVRWARVEVAGQRLGGVGVGLLALVGVRRGDGMATARLAADKVAALRIFEDEEGRMNLDLAAVAGGVLVVPQFTLCASLGRGRRPSFEGAAPAESAQPLVEAFARRLEELGLRVERGRFGAHMEVSLLNDGPVTLVLDVDEPG